MLLKGSEIFIKALQDEGVEHLFGYPGGSVLEIYDCLYRSKLKHYLVRHEQAAAHAADGYARSTGKVGVCLATSGPGATNLVTGLATAHLDSIPMVAFTGQCNTDSIGKDAFQEADVFGITLPITKHNFLVKNIDELTSTIREAFCLAKSGRPGPVLVDIPKDITRAKAEYVPAGCVKACQNNKSKDVDVNEELIRSIPIVNQMIKKSKKPVILAGGGIISSGANEELLEFAEAIQSPVSTTFMGLGIFPPFHPLNLRMPGMHGTAFANYSLYEADLIIGIGARFDDRITGDLKEFGKNAKIIHVDIDPVEIDKCVQTDLSIVGDAKLVLQALLSSIKNDYIDYSNNKSDWIKHILDLKKRYPITYDYDEKVIRPQYVIEELNKAKENNAIITTDVGKHQMWATQYIDYFGPRTFISSGGLGTMGFGLPAAIGAQVANPDKQVICITSEGSIQMNIQELSTISYYKLPIKIVILNNQSLGMVRQWQELFYEKRFSHTCLEGMAPDFSKLAAAYDIPALTSDRPDDVQQIIKKSFDLKGPVIIDLKTDKDENVFPMVPPGGVLNNIVFGPTDRQKDGKE